MADPLRQYSKFLSLVLRHQPEVLELALDEQGWTPVDALLEALRRKDRTWTPELLQRVVSENTKRRFEFNNQGTKIRARQGHSVPVELGYAPTVPPDVLFHGTVQRVLPLILEEGLRKMARHHVHLSAEIDTASAVGGRRGKPTILVVDAGAMSALGFAFYLSNNGVWLTDHVPPKFLTVFNDSES